MKQSIVIVGGHLSPALAVIDELLLTGNYDIHFFGRMQTFAEHQAPSLEYQTITALHIPFYPVNPPRMAHVWSLQMMRCIMLVRKLLSSIRPRAVVSFGGYVGGTVAFAAWTLGIPVVVHEQTHHAGVANRMSSFFGRYVLLGFRDAAKTFSPLARRKMIVTGNPIRKEVLEMTRHPATKKDLTLYITGGSTGAHAINELVQNVLSGLLDAYEVYHQCGESQYHDYERLLTMKSTLSPKLQLRYHPVKFVTGSEFIRVFNAADIIVGRSGANTVVELGVTGKVAILIPLPHARFDEQQKNAQLLEKAGSAVIMRQHTATGHTLLEKINYITAHFDTYHQHAIEFSHSKEMETHRQASRVVVSYIDRIVGSYVRD